MVAMVSGCFDMLHPGHVHMLYWASRFGRLAVALRSDCSIRLANGGQGPLIPESDRKFMLEQLWFVSGVILYHDDKPLRIIAEVLPEYYIIGHEESDASPESDLVKSYGAEVLKAPYYSGYDTESMLERLYKCLQSSATT